MATLANNTKGQMRQHRKPPGKGGEKGKQYKKGHHHLHRTLKIIKKRKREARPSKRKNSGKKREGLRNEADGVEGKKRKQGKRQPRGRTLQV